MTGNLPGKQPFNVVKDLGKPYRLWCKARTKGNPIVILVHGAVVPLPGAAHDLNTINNDKYCFYDLDSLLYHDFEYNVFTFEYADELIPGLGYVNYHNLEPHSKCLVEAIGFAKKSSEQPDGTVGPVTIIAHSMGGLIARCAAKMADGMISMIITLDTGHLGFELAKVIKKIATAANITLPSSIGYEDEVLEGSDFLTKLNDKFNSDNPKLVSIAACDPVDISSIVGIPLPVPGITVTALHSSSMRQVNDSGHRTDVNCNMSFYPLPNYNHANIMQITDSNHCAYKVIQKYLGKDVNLCDPCPPQV